MLLGVLGSSALDLGCRVLGFGGAFVKLLLDGIATCSNIVLIMLMFIYYDGSHCCFRPALPPKP